MDAVKREQWEAAGIDVESALGRFMGNEMLLERFMKKFLEDSNFENLRKALAAKDLDAAISASHTLKGLCGNLSMTVLFDLITKQVAVLRAGRLEEAAAMMEEILPAYEMVTETIRRG